MSFFNQYIDYFKYQCENHALLLHDDAVGDRVFEVISVEEALGDFRTAGKEKGYAFRLLEPIYFIGDNGNAPIRKTAQCGFIIAKYHGVRTGSADAYMTAMDDAESVSNDFVSKMIADSQNGHPLFFYSLDSRQNINVTPTTRRADGTYSGWIITFQISINFDDCPSANWLDDGLTPFG